MPQGYGVPDTAAGLLEWPAVADRLRQAKHYWLASTRPDGRPHVIPRWGVWVENRFWYDGSPDTVHTRNLTANPACTVHLEDGAQAVILEGTSGPADPPDAELAGLLSDAFVAKYAADGYEPQPDAWDGPGAGGLSMLTPQRALAWFDFPTDVTRFRFGAVTTP